MHIDMNLLELELKDAGIGIISRIENFLGKIVLGLHISWKNNSNHLIL